MLEEGDVGCGGRMGARGGGVVGGGGMGAGGGGMVGGGGDGSWRILIRS